MGQPGAVTRRRLVVTGILLCLWGAGVGARLFDLHVVQADYYRERASDQHLRELELSPQRGAIRDRNGNDLAISIEVDSLYAEPARVESPEATAGFLAPVLHESVDALLDRLTDDRSFVWLKRKLTASQAETIRAAGIAGLGFQKESKRFYPNVGLAAHVLGFVNLDNHGVGGLEYQYDGIIGGTPGRVIVERDARNVTFERREQSPTEGASLVTTIDTNIQHFVEAEIDRTVRETGAVGMSVIVMEPDTGAVLAMANYPTFNPNEYSRFPESSWSNRAIKHGYEPGSTFKIATASAVLEEGLATLDEIVDGQNGMIMVQGYRIRDHRPFGLVSLREVLQYSSNVGIIKFGQRLGDARFARYIERYGFGQKTGIDLMGEEKGLVRDPSEWSGLSSSVISMGQELLATPLQVLNLAATVGNGGTMYRPFVVKRVEYGDGRVEETRPEGRDAISSRTAGLLQVALKWVVVDGTGKSAAIPGFTAAGKTGTAQKIDPATGRYSTSKYVASFVGYAPARNPSIAVIVVVDEPRGSYYGGDVAAPVFGRIGEQVLRYLGVQPDAPPIKPNQTEDGKQKSSPLSNPQPELMATTWMPEGPIGMREASFDQARPAAEVGDKQMPVPNLIGQPLRDVVELTARLGLRLVSSGSGVAVDQRPPPGALVARDSRIEVLFSTAGRVPSSTQASVP